MIEQLEQRQLFADLTVTLAAGGVASITGGGMGLGVSLQAGPGNTVIMGVSAPNGVASAPGTPAGPWTITSLNIQLGNGGDEFTLQSDLQNVPTTLRGGGGDDQFYLQGFFNNLLLNGQSGNDHLDARAGSWGAGSKIYGGIGGFDVLELSDPNPPNNTFFNWEYVVVFDPS